MATYFERGSINDSITTAEKHAALAQTLRNIGRTPRRVLILPPDHTRLNSDAGELTRLLYEMLAPTATVDNLDAMMKRYNPNTLKDGFNKLPDGEELFYISNPALGLWGLKSQFGVS